MYKFIKTAIMTDIQKIIFQRKRSIKAKSWRGFSKARIFSICNSNIHYMEDAVIAVSPLGHNLQYKGLV